MLSWHRPGSKRHSVGYANARNRCTSLRRQQLLPQLGTSWYFSRRSQAAMRDDLGQASPLAGERRLQRPARHHGNDRLRETIDAVRVPGPGLPGTGHALAGTAQVITVGRGPHREYLNDASIIQVPIYQVRPIAVGNFDPHRSASIACRKANVTASALHAHACKLGTALFVSLIAVCVTLRPESASSARS
jgi:hypothetical protein